MLSLAAMACANRAKASVILAGIGWMPDGEVMGFAPNPELLEIPGRRHCEAVMLPE